MKFNREVGIWLIAYGVLMASVVGVLVYARAAVLSRDTVVDREAWQEWREKATEQNSGVGPVFRKIPKSQEPPSLVLMRDHFAPCVLMTCLICTAMFGAFAFFVRGVMAAPSMPTGRKAAQN